LFGPTRIPEILTPSQQIPPATLRLDPIRRARGVGWGDCVVAGEFADGDVVDADANAS